jgi:hypothetical protein
MYVSFSSEVGICFATTVNVNESLAFSFRSVAVIVQVPSL